MGPESVWDYPRPPRVEPSDEHVVVKLSGTVVVDTHRALPRSQPAYSAMIGHVAMCAGPFYRVTVDGEVVVPQDGGFYGGWITGRVTGPIKGGPCSWGW